MSNEDEFSNNEQSKTEKNIKISFSPSEMEVKKRYYLLINKLFVQKYGINFALLISELDRLTYSMEVNADEEGFLELSSSLIKKDIRLSKDQIKPLVDRMIKMNFVNVKYTHNGRRKLYRLNRDVIIASLSNLTNDYEKKKRGK